MARAAVEVQMDTWTDVQQHLVIGVQSSSQAHLITYLMDWIRKLPMNERIPLLHISMPCGQSITYNDFPDLPEHSIPCTCSNAAHWFIRYEMPPQPAPMWSLKVAHERAAREGDLLVERMTSKLSPKFTRAG